MKDSISKPYSVQGRVNHDRVFGKDVKRFRCLSCGWESDALFWGIDMSKSVVGVCPRCNKWQSLRMWESNAK